MIELFPEGFEEVRRADGVELVAYTDSGGEERLWQAFGGVGRAEDVANGWEDRWRQFHRPVRVGSLWIGPSWHDPPPDAVVVVVDPGRAFGTGAHPTTRLCLELLERAGRGSLLDVGCGSGVLAIAAAKLGFAPVSAVDVDPVSVETTEANARANGVGLDILRLDAVRDPLPEADVAVVNIALEVVDRIAVRSSTLVTSGYFADAAPAPPGFVHAGRRTDDRWAADLWRRE
jgi:ribosomal protein L11 methyltransferase